MKRMAFLSLVLLCGGLGFLEAQTVKIDNGGSITVKAAKELTSDNPFITPSDGMKFVGFDILIDNTKGKSDISLNLFLGSFEIKDNQGYSYTPSLYDVAEPSLDVNATIEKDDSLRGWITVEVPRSTKLSDLRLRLKASTKSAWITITK
jgi:hypothetical protein